MSDAGNPLAHTLLIGPGSVLGQREQALLEDLRRKDREHADGIPGDASLDPYRRRRVELTLEEMWAQPNVLAKTLETDANAVTEIARTLVNGQLHRLYIVGCGDSLSIAIAAQPLLERLLGIPCEALEALEYVDYLYRSTDRRTAVLGISSSGTTPRTVEALLRARSRDARTIGVSNSPDSPLLREAHYGLCVPATRKGWPTQATTAAMAMLFRLGIEAGRVRGVGTLHIERELAGVPSMMDVALRRLDDSMAQLASALVTKPLQLFSGGGQIWGTALIGAAKVRECTVKHALAIHVEEYHHYNSQKAGDPLFLVAPQGPSLFRAIDTARVGRGWKGLVYVLADPHEHRFDGIADHVFAMPAISEELSPLVYVIPLQLFAYHLSMAEFSMAASSA